LTPISQARINHGDTILSFLDKNGLIEHLVSAIQQDPSGVKIAAALAGISNPVKTLAPATQMSDKYSRQYQVLKNQYKDITETWVAANGGGPRAEQAQYYRHYKRLPPTTMSDLDIANALGATASNPTAKTKGPAMREKAFKNTLEGKLQNIIRNENPAMLTQEYINELTQYVADIGAIPSEVELNEIRAKHRPVGAGAKRVVNQARVSQLVAPPRASNTQPVLPPDAQIEQQVEDMYAQPAIQEAMTTALLSSAYIPPPGISDPF
jgi:hypothetical protein